MRSPISQTTQLSSLQEKKRLIQEAIFELGSQFSTYQQLLRCSQYQYLIEILATYQLRLWELGAPADPVLTRMFADENNKPG